VWPLQLRKARLSDFHTSSFVTHFTANPQLLSIIRNGTDEEVLASLENLVRFHRNIRCLLVHPPTSTFDGTKVHPHSFAHILCQFSAQMGNLLDFIGMHVEFANT